MKSALIALFFPLAALASPFDSLTKDHPVCFGREYSTAHMAAHPLQTVKLLKLKFYKDEFAGSETSYLDIKAEIKREQTDKESGEKFTVFKPYSSGMSCFLKNDRLNCNIDCDGGSAKVAWNVTQKGNEVLFKNEGFVLVGGCGEDETDTIWLDPKKGGDDVFRLFALPSEFCQQ